MATRYLSPSRLAYTTQLGAGQYVMPDFFPDWALNYTGKGGLVTAMERGRQFSDWVDKSVAQQQAGGQLRLEKQKDSPIYDMIGKYQAELPLKGPGMEAEWWGSADVLINAKDGPILGDFKLHGKWSPGQYAPQKYAPQLTAYQSVFEERYGSKPDLATIHVSNDTYQFLKGALEDPDSGIKPTDIMDELTNSSNATHWTSPKVASYAEATQSKRQREVLYHRTQPTEAPQMQNLIDAHKRYDEAIEAATGMTRGAFRRAMSSEPLEQDKERWYAVMDEVHFRAQMYASGVYTDVGVVRDFVSKAKPILPGYTEGSSIASTIKDYGQVKAAPQARRGVAPYEPLRNQNDWQQLDENLGDSVLWNKNTGEVAVTHQREGAYGRDVYWRGTVEKIGSQVAVNGRLLVPQQMARHDVIAGQKLPGQQWEEESQVLPAIFSKAVGMVKELGGGVNAAKAITQHMNQALQPMPSVRSDVFSTSAARMAYSQGLMGLQSDFSVKQQYRAMGQYRAMRGGSSQSFDLRQLAEAAGFAYDPEKDKFYGGETKPGSIFKRTRAGLRAGELVTPTKTQGGARVWDADRMMISPLVQRDPTAKGKASRYGPEIGVVARAATFAHGGLMSEGMGVGSREFLGMGDDQMWSQQISDTISIEGRVGFTGLDQAYFDEESGGFVIGYVENDPNNKIVWSKQKWDRFDLGSKPKVRQEGGKTFIDLEGTVSSRGGSGQLKAWMGNKAMLTAIENMDELFGSNAGRGLDVILPKAKNVRQFAYALISAKYRDDPEMLAKRIYGEDRHKQFMVHEQMQEGAGGIALGGEAVGRLQEIRGRMGKKAAYQGVLMPIDEADQERMYGLANEIAKERMQENSQYRMHVTDMEYEMLKKSGIVMKNLGTKRGKGQDRVRHIEAQVPAIFSDLMMQVGREFPGEAQVSPEELLGLATGAGGGDEYRQAMMNRVLPNIMRSSGHYRKMYSDILTARMHTRREAGVEVSAERVIDFKDLQGHMGDLGRNTTEFLTKLGGLEQAKGKFIKIGDMLLPPVETLAALQVPDDPAKTMPWLDEEQRRKYAIDTKDVSAITNAFMKIMEKGANTDEFARLEQALYGTGVGGQKLGLAMTPAVAKGVMAARMSRGGIEGAAVSYTGIDDNIVVMGKDKLKQMFGTDDYSIVNEAIKKGAYAAIQRRPNVFPELSSMIGVRIESADSEYAGLRGIPSDFSGMAFGKMVAGMMFGDYDGDRVMALLTSTIAQTGEGEVKDKTAGVVKYAASQRGMYERWAQGMAHIMGHEDARALVGRKEGEDYTAADMLKLNVMLGKEYSEVYKMMDDLTEDQKGYLGAMMAPEAKRGGALADMFLNKMKFMAGVSADELRGALEGEAYSKEETSRAYNRLLREMHGYISESGEGDPALAATLGFRSYQKTLDMSGFSKGLRGYLNMWEGYNAWGKGKSLQERLGPVGAEGQILSRQVNLYAMKDDFTTQLMQNMLDTEELWGVPKSAADRKAGTGYRLADDEKARWRAQAAGISTDKDTQDLIYKELAKGGGAQEIWDNVFGKDVAATDPTQQSRGRFTAAWKNAGWLMGAPGAAAFARMKRSMYAGDMSTVVQRTAEWDRLNRQTGGQLERLAGYGKQMGAQTAVLSGRGGKALPQNIENFPNLPGSAVMDEMLSWLDESIPKRQPPGEIANLLRYITGGEDDLLKTLEGLGVDAESLSESMPALRSMVEGLQSEAMGYKEGQWQETGLVPRVLSEWSQKATGEGGLGAVLRQLGQRQAGGQINVPGAFQYQTTEGYAQGASAGIARAIGLTSAGAAPLAIQGQQRMAVGGAAGQMQSRQAAQAGGQMGMGQALAAVAGQAAETGNEQMLWAVRNMTGQALFGGKERQPVGERMAKLQAQPTSAATYGMAYDIVRNREAAEALTEKRHGVAGAGSLQAAMSVLEKTGDIGAMRQVMPELTEEHVSRLQGLNDALDTWEKTVGPAAESGKELTKTQVQYTKVLEKSLAEVPRLRMMAEAGEGPLAEQALGLTQRLQGAGGALAPAQAQIEQQRWKELQGEVGRGAGARRLFRGLTGGFEMMRLQRMWGMTGGMAMGAVQPAAQEEMLALQAAGMGMPSGQFQMGGLAEGILTGRARQQQFQLGMGRAAGRAYSPYQRLLAQPAFGEAAGIGLPAVGAGLIASQLAGMAGLAAGPAGLAVAGLTALGGTASHLASSTGSERAGAMARAGRGELSLDLLASGTGRKTVLSGLAGVAAAPGDIISGAVNRLTGSNIRPVSETLSTMLTSEADRSVMERAERIRSGELSGQSMEDRAQTIQYAYREAAPQWMEQTAAEQLGAEYMRYTPEATNIQDIYRSRQFRQMGARGESVEQFVKMAGQWGGAPEDWQQYQELYAGVAPSAVPGMEYTAGKWEPARRGYGMAGIDILGAAASPFEEAGRRDVVSDVASNLGDALSGATSGLLDFGDALGDAVDATQLQAETLTTLQTTQFQQAAGTAERARMMGLAVDAPPEQLTGAWAEQQFREQMPLLQGRMGIQQQLMGMGLGMEGGTAAAEQFGTTGQMQMFQRFLGGDSRVMSMLGQAAVGQQNVPLGYGMQVDAGQMRGQYLGALQTGMEGAGYSQPQIAQSMDALTQAFDDLRPVIETDTGLRMGTTRMWEGWAQDVTGGANLLGQPTRQQKRAGFLEEQGMAAPLIGGYGGVDEDRLTTFADLLQDKGVRGLQAQQQTLQNQNQQFQMDQRGRALQWSRVSQLGGTFEEPGVGEITTRGSLAITKELRGLGRLWEDFTSTYNERSREVSRSQFLENWDVQAGRMPQQFGWQREDLAAQGAQASMQYGWSMEDAQEAMRFATGRDRRKIQRQMERQTIGFGTQMGRLETQGERVDTREQWAREDLDRQRRQFLERNSLQDEYQSRYRSHMESRRSLEDEMHAIQEFNAKFSLEQAEEAFAWQVEYQEQMKAINATMTLYSQSLENANAQMGQVVQMIQFIYANMAVGGGGELNWSDAAAGFFQNVLEGFSALSSAGTQLPNRRGGPGSYQ